MKVQILDYSTHRGAATLFKRYLPDSVAVLTHYIDSAAAMTKAMADSGITHVIHSGSNLSINAQHPFSAQVEQYIRQLAVSRIQQLGICFGHQLLCRVLVGAQAVRRSPNGLEAGWREVQFMTDATSIPGLSGVQTVWQHHFDEVIQLPPGSELIATAGHTAIQAWLNPELRLMGTQFHPEFDQHSGNAYFINDSELLRQHGFNVDQLIRSGPSAEHGRLWFDYFLSRR